jgi:hypothetical protein
LENLNFYFLALLSALKGPKGLFFSFKGNSPVTFKNGHKHDISSFVTEIASGNQSDLMEEKPNSERTAFEFEFFFLAF